MNPLDQDLGIPEHRLGLVWYHQHQHASEMTLAHTHREWELNLVTQGSAQLVGPGGSITLGPQAMVWIYPGHEHLLIHQSWDFEMWIAVFTPELFELIRPESSKEAFDWEQGKASDSVLLNQSQFEKAIEQCQQVSHEQQPGMASVFNAGLLYLLLKMREYHAASKSTLPREALHPVVQQVMALLHDDEQSCTLEALGHACEMTPNHLGYLLKHELGMSLVELRQQIRMKRFFGLQAQYPDKNMMQLALASGFGSYAQFHRAFKTQQGISPRAWRSRRRTD